MPIAFEEFDVEGLEGFEFILDGLLGLDEFGLAGEEVGGGPNAEFELKKSAAEPLPVSSAGVLVASGVIK